MLSTKGLVGTKIKRNNINIYIFVEGGKVYLNDRSNHVLNSMKLNRRFECLNNPRVTRVVHVERIVVSR